MAGFRVVAGGFSCGPKTAAEKDPAPSSPLPLAPVVLEDAGDGATLVLRPIEGVVTEWSRPFEERQRATFDIREPR